jgi:putative ABC transport system ATP-binding protein
LRQVPVVSNMNAKPVIQLSNIKKVFYTEQLETWALNDISLVVNEGEYVAIGGQSGCGKSTLLSVMGLLSSPSHGVYILDDLDASGLNRTEQARMRNTKIGFVFQAFNLISDMSVLENIELPLKYRKDISRKRRLEMALEALEKVDMEHRKHHMPSQLSGGQQQRVAIARALVGNPAVLLADEPTGNLDSKNANMVMELLGALNEQGSTICMVTHDPRFAVMAKRQISLFDGRVVDDRAVT